MTIKRLDHVSIVVDDLAAAVAFFTALLAICDGVCNQRFADGLKSTTAEIVSDLLMWRDHLRAIVVVPTTRVRNIIKPKAVVNLE